MRESIEDIPEAAEILDAEDSFLKIVIGDKQERTIMYPCRDNTTLNLVAVCSDSESSVESILYLTPFSEVMNEESSQSWQQAGNVQDMVRTFQEFPAWVQTLLRYAAVFIYRRSKLTPSAVPNRLVFGNFAIRSL